MSQPKQNCRNTTPSLTKEYRREYARRRRQNIGNDKVNTENRKSYHRKIAALLTIQEQELPDPENKVLGFVVSRMLRNAKHRALKLGIEFNLTKDDLVFPDVCPISLRPMRLGVLGKDSRDSYSLDRIDNSKGYTKDNVRVISKEANATKGAFDIAYFERLIAYMKGEL